MADEQTLLTSAATPTEPVAAAETAAQAADTGTDASAAAAASEDWRPESLRTEKWTEKYKSTEEALKAFGEAQKLLGKKAEGIVPPADDDPQEVKDAFNAKLRELRGVPGEDKIAEAYAVAPPEGAPEGYELNANLVGAFQKLAFESGMAPAEFQKMAAGYMQMEVQSIVQGRADAKAAQDKAESALVKGWQDEGKLPKDEFTKALKGAQALGLVGKDGKDNILGHLGNNTALIKALADNVYPLISEGKLKGGGRETQAQVLSPREAVDKARVMMADPRYANPTTRDPEYVRQVQAFVAQHQDAINSTSSR